MTQGEKESVRYFWKKGPMSKGAWEAFRSLKDRKSLPKRPRKEHAQLTPLLLPSETWAGFLTYRTLR